MEEFVAKMTRTSLLCFTRLVATLILFSLPLMSAAQPKHGIAMYGNPVLPPDFVSLPYANPNAPKGGRIAFGERGGFDSFNPYIRKGRAPWGVRVHVYETLMGRNWDEPFALYGLLAESIEVGANREWVEFTLRPEAKFSDGSPVTVEDVIWSFETLAEKGVPRYKNSWNKVATSEKTGPRSVRFTFNVIDRELPLILGLRPVMKKSDWLNRDFADSSLDVPTGSGPYVIKDFEANRFVTFQRNPDYWGRDLAYSRGLNNLDQIKYEYFNDGSVIFEAFVAGETSVYRELNAQKWEDQFDFPAAQRGEITKSIIPHSRPSGMRGFVFNTRRKIFADWRVRDALVHAYNFEFINRVVNEGRSPRAQSYFSNSELGMRENAASGAVLALLDPFADSLLPGALEGYSLPQSNGKERNRKNLKVATAQLQAAGWNVGGDGVLRNADGLVFEFEIMLRSQSNEVIANLFAQSLKRLGIGVTLKIVDNAQHKTRRDTYDFDMMFNVWSLSLSPGNEQNLYWGSNGVETPGTRNFMGMNAPAADAMIEEILTSTSRDDFVSATRALDRVLTTGRYVIPVWYNNISRLAHKSELKFPETLPAYGDWLGFLPEVWWWQE
ncbi:MAG: peptide/nickel transport system substrate-binding protein [Paracoccaceae bacterium]|jgi:peptide/nickel transport system substrate-binding protein